MAAPACGSCGAPVNGATLCSGCTRELAEKYLRAADIAGDLDDAVARLLRRGSGGRRSETEAPLPVDLAASEVKYQLAALLGRHVRAVHDLPGRRGESWPLYSIASCARWLAARTAVIRQMEAAPAMLAALRTVLGRALAVIDQRPERAPAGTCDNCGRQLLAELGADEVRCACGALTVALQDKRRERAAAADVLGTAAEISGALARIGITVPRGTITSWVSRGRLVPRPGGALALSDVLALASQSKAKVRG